MSLTRHDPWNQLNQLYRELDRLLDTRGALNQSEDNSQVVTCDWIPAVDIKEEPERFVLHADIPGVEPQDIEITMNNGMLTIKGERKTETTEERVGYKRVERARGTFYRRFSLPETADAGKISAKSTNGVLEVVIPKQDRGQSRKIAVES